MSGEYMAYRNQDERNRLQAAYPGKVNRWDRYLNICPACGGYFTCNRSDKKCCDSTCRSMLARRKARVDQPFQGDLPWEAPF